MSLWKEKKVNEVIDTQKSSQRQKMGDLSTNHGLPETSNWNPG